MEQMMSAYAIIALNARKCFRTNEQSLKEKKINSKLMDTLTDNNKAKCKRSSSLVKSKGAYCTSSDKIKSSRYASKHCDDNQALLVYALKCARLTDTIIALTSTST